MFIINFLFSSDKKQKYSSGLTIIRLNTGFTIVELLVVIVVIGILAAISIVSYAGITERAVTARITSDLNNDAKLLELYKVEHESYPTAIGSNNNCPTAPAVDNKYCLIVSEKDDTLTYTGTTNNYTLTITDDDSNLAFQTTPGGEVVAVDGDGGGSGGESGTSLQLSAGSAYTACALKSNGSVYCWGMNYDGEFGNNTSSDSSKPVASANVGLLNGKIIKSISVGQFHTCAIASDDLAYCWGDNSYGQLGNGTNDNSLAPVAVDTSDVLSGKTIKSISASGNTTCAIASDKNAYCWGYGQDGQNGNGSNSDTNTPVAVSKAGVLSGKTIESISTGYSSVCAIASDYQAYCWGLGGTLGNGIKQNSNVPVAVNTGGVLSGKTIKSISTGDIHACVIASDNLMYCWGLNGDGQVGNNTTNEIYSPVAVDTTGVLSGKTILAISEGASHSCAIASDNKVYCWGYDGDGVLGNGTANDNTDVKTPVAVDTSGVLNGKTITKLSSTGFFTCVADLNDSIYCWGYGGDGELGNNASSDSSSPVKVVDLP